MPEQTSTLTLTAPSDREVVMTRDFDAPRELVFEAHSKCEHIERWWGLRDNTLAVCELDFRVGGKWRFVERDKNGNEFGFRGEFREIDSPERFVWTFEFEGMPGHICVSTFTFIQHDGRTTLTEHTLFDSVEDRDGMIESSMEAGAAESLDRLAELLTELTG